MNGKLIIFFLIVVFGIALQASSPDYGAFERDYFQAHLLGMEHLGQIDIFFDQLVSIPNSASGVIPLTIMGLFDGYEQRYVINILMLMLTLFVFFKKSQINHFLLFLSFIIFSPTFMSSLKWLLPEVMSISFVLLLFSLHRRHKLSRYLMSIFVPLFRQTFIVFLALEGLLDFGKKLKDKFENGAVATLELKFAVTPYRETIAQLAFGSIGLGFLYYFWGGLVPPKLAAVHNTFSVKASLTAFLIFGLYFSLFCIQKLFKLNSMPSTRKIVICLTAAVLFCLAYYHSEALAGGGYVFSRFEVIFPASVYLMLFVYVSLLLLFLPMPVLLSLIFFSLSFITTNHMYLKYVDQYMILLFGYFIVSRRATGYLFSNREFDSLMSSFVAFQIASLALAHYYYA